MRHLTPGRIVVVWAWLASPAAAALAGDHWAFQAVVRPPLPNVENQAWVRNAIDCFNLARLEQEGLEPSAEADRVTLIRRLSLDLLGLPPSIAEVDAFVADTAPDAYERLVDRLLASPHYGERWGRHWLDLARYADSNGYDNDEPRPFAWLYRNWVIDAINHDMPFDQFTIEQLAGDLVASATLAQRVATGFHRNTPTNTEGGVDREEFRVKTVVDRVNTLGTVWLGLTVGCAQCHSHKYDPLTQQEYYGLFAFWNHAQEAEIAAPQPGEAAAYRQAKEAFDRRQAELDGALGACENELPRRQSEWEASLRSSGDGLGWIVLEPIRFTSAGGADMTMLPDKSLVVSGARPDKDTYTIVADTALEGITAVLVEVLPDPSLPNEGPGRQDNGNLVLSEFRLTAAGREEAGDRAPIALAGVTADWAPADHPVVHALDGKQETGWAIDPYMGQAHAAVFRTSQPIGFAAGTTLTFTVDQQYGLQTTIGRIRISATAAGQEDIAKLVPESIRQIVARPPDERSDAERGALARYYRSIDAPLAQLRRAVEEHARQAPAEPAARAQVLQQDPSPPATHLFIRGDFLRPGAEVLPHTFAVLHPFHPRGEKPDRLDLAEWLFDPANPLTARVAVNRAWQHLFGRGLVATVEDFGTQGERPTHPELLDWLAAQFVARGWSQKALVRLIVQSSTYRQHARISAQLAERDPTNALLARQNRFRIEGEILRDLALTASGLLHRTVGGPSVQLALPPDEARAARWQEAKGPDRYRRGMYIFVQRTVPYPVLATFDAPDSHVTCPRRDRSNTPLQALVLLNDPVFVECAQALGRRIVALEGGEIADRIRYGFRLCLAREPNLEELARLKQLHAEQLAFCRENPEAAAALAGAAPLPAGVTPADAAAWVGVGRTLLNLDEFVTRE